MEPLYKLTIVGVKAGRDITTIRSKLKSLINSDNVSVDKILSTLAANGQVIAANDMPLAKIEQHKASLEDIGLQCATEICLSLSPIAEEVAASVCPACNAPLPDAAESFLRPCSNCGVVPRKFLDNQERRQMLAEERERLLTKMHLQADREIRQAEIDEKERQRQQLREQVEHELGLRRKMAWRKRLTIGAVATSVSVAIGFGANTYLHRDPVPSSVENIQTAGIGPEGQTSLVPEAASSSDADKAVENIVAASDPTAEETGIAAKDVASAQALAKAQAIADKLPAGKVAKDVGGAAAGAEVSTAVPGPSQTAAEVSSLDLEYALPLARLALSFVEVGQDDVAVKLLVRSYEKLSRSSVDKKALLATAERIKVEMLSSMAAHQSKNTRSSKDIFERAAGIAARIDLPSEQAKAWSFLAKQQMLVNNKLAATEMFDKALLTARSITNPTQRLEATALIGGRFAESGDLIRAQEVLDDIKGRVQKPSDHIPAVVAALAQTEVLSALAEAQMAINGERSRLLFASALEIARSIDSRAQRALAFSTIALRKARANLADEAYTLASETSGMIHGVKNSLDQRALVAEVKYRLVATLGTVAGSQRKQNKPSASDDSFAQAIREVDDLESSEDRALLLGVIGKQELSAGLPDKSKYHFNEALRLAGATVKTN